VAEGSVASERFADRSQTRHVLRKRHRMFVVKKQNNSNQKTLAFYQAVLAFLRETGGEYVEKMRAVQSTAVEANTSWNVDDRSLDHLLCSRHGNLRFIGVAEAFVAKAFGDLCQMRNPVAYEVYWQIQGLCGVRDPAFALRIVKKKRCDTGRGGLLIICVSDVDAAVRSIKDAAGRGDDPEGGGKVMY
jgi:hypothetical protein